MKRYLVVRCSKCGEARVTTASKTFICYKCGQLNRIAEESIIAYASSAEEARTMILKLKQPKLNG